MTTSASLQKLVDDEITLSHGQSCAGCLLALGYARRATPRTWTFHERPGVSHTATIRPPVSPEVREALIEALLKVPGNELGPAHGEPGFWPYFSDDEEDRRDAGRFVDAILAQLPALDAEWMPRERPPVGPEVREEIRAVVGEQLTKAGLDLNGAPYSDDGETQWPLALELRDRLTDALLARFSLPVLDVEKVARVIQIAANSSEDRSPGQTRAEWYAAALVAALRAGELIREETNE